MSEEKKLIHIELKAEDLKRIDEAAETALLTQEAFILQALENELIQREIDLATEEVTLKEIEGDILAEGQEVDISESDKDLASEKTEGICELCLAKIPPPVTPVDGPLFCEPCLEMAESRHMINFLRIS